MRSSASSSASVCSVFWRCIACLVVTAGVISCAETSSTASTDRDTGGDIPTPECESDDDCALGEVCNADGECVAEDDAPIDTDGDGVPDTDDNCVDAVNPDQADSDGDGVGDACEGDRDSDGILDDGDGTGEPGDGTCVGGETTDCDDNCIETPNADQADSDADGVGDVCDPDRDGDGVPQDGDGNGTDGDNPCADGATTGCDDNCPDTPNDDQLDSDGDGAGDACDPGDGDADGDGVLDDIDNCVDVPNSDQIDSDGDGLGDACDPDRDGDGILDNGDGSPSAGDDACADRETTDCDDNCRSIPNPDQADRDSDGQGDACDDTDGDGVFDDVDNCVEVRNPDQRDLDGDGQGDVCDDDRDGDGIDNGDDNCPDVANPAQTDSDRDGTGDDCDADTVLRIGYYDYDSACTFTPVIGDFTPALEWSFSVSSTDPAPTKNQVMMTPLVANLNDDNGDGNVDTLDIPDIIFTTFNVRVRIGTFDFLDEGVVRAVSGDGSGLLWTSPVGTGIQAGGNLAVGDIDGDGRVEIVASRFEYTDSAEGGLVAFNHDGTLLWESVPTPLQAVTFWGGPSIADLTGDGDVEIVFGSTVYEGTTGTVVWNVSSAGRGNNLAAGSTLSLAPLSTVADILPSAGLEVIAGNTYYSATGTILWQDAARNDGFPAIADFNGDGVPEIVVVSQGSIRIQNPAGAIVWGPLAVPTFPGGTRTGRLGPPTVADFDGDGRPEVGVAGSNQYVTLNVDLATPSPAFEDALLWRTRTVDESSNITGSSVFDFDADGSVEVVYNDEQFLRVFSGIDGAVLFEVPNTSYTAVEYPVIADVDNDGNAEIIVVANNFEDFQFTPGPFAGIRVYGDAGDNWVNTRRIWNQHAYSISHINEDGSVPRTPSNSWTTHNTFRLNAQGEGDELLAPDLVADDAITLADECDLAIGVWVANTGATPVRAGLPVTFYFDGDRTDPAARITVSTRFDLAPGDGELVVANFIDIAPGPHTVLISVDDDGEGASGTSECSEDNNVIVVPDVECSGT